MTRRLLVLAILAFWSIYSPAQGPATGMPPFGSFSPPPDTINLGNLNVHWAMPFFSKPGRGLPFAYTWTFDNSQWSISTVGGPPTWMFNEGWQSQSTGSVKYKPTTARCRQNVGDPWTVDNVYTLVSYTDPAGTSHPLNNAVIADDNTCVPHDPYSVTVNVNDGSGYVVYAAADSPPRFLIYTPSGITLTPANGTIIDSNGNYITIGATSLTDTLGAPVMTLGSIGSSPETYTYPTTTTAGTAQVLVAYTTYTLQTAFNCSGNPGVQDVSYANWRLPTSVTYPDGSAYTIGYEQTPGFGSTYTTGRVASVTLPTGGQISYAYTGANDGISCTDGSTLGLTRTSPDGTTTYVRTGGATSTTTITDATSAQNQTVVSFSNGFETERQIYAGAVNPSNLLETAFTCYNGTTLANCAGPSAAISSRAVYVQWPGGQTSHTVTSYNNIGLPTEVDEYDFGASNPTRKTVTSYASLGNNIQDRVSSVSVQDGSSNPVALTN